MKKLVLITGVAGGIGTATAELFTDRGWDVVGIDKAAPEESGTCYRFFKGDVSEPEFIRTLFTELTGSKKRLDALVNNAAMQICVPLIEMKAQDWDMIMAANARAAFLMAKHACSLLRVSCGAIINISSVHAVATSNNIAAYAASKGALLALTRAMAIEFAADNIRVNTVLPGAVDTLMLRDNLQSGDTRGKTAEELIIELGKRHLLGRIGRPEEIARAIYFLADNEESSFITGQSLIVDGGATARLSTER